MTQSEKSTELANSIDAALAWLTLALQQIDEPDDDCQTAIRGAIKVLTRGIERCNEVGESEGGKE